MNDYLKTDAIENGQRYLVARESHEQRYASWDHCYNYFRTAFDEQKIDSLASRENLQTSCLQVGFYLASWGMYRGKAPLLQKSSSVLVPFIELVTSAPTELWTLDVEDYDNDSVALLLHWAKIIRETLPGKSTDTLVTKAMLGVFGNTPAFDRYFRKGFDCFGLNTKSLMKIKSYFDANQQRIEDQRVKTIDFVGKSTDYRYTQAKVIDMIFFAAGGGMGN
jgi:hypothetical protein